MKIGARLIKTGIAVTVTMFICKALSLEPAFFGAVSAVVNMQPSIFLSLKTATDQVFVHILGVVAGLAVGYLIGGNPIAMGLVTVIIILLYKKLHFKSSITMGIVAALFILSSSQEQFVGQALARTSVIFVGLATAMIINVLLFPPRYSQGFASKLQASNEAAVNYFCLAVSEYVRLADNKPDFHLNQKAAVYRLNSEVRAQFTFIRQEGELLASSAQRQEWLTVIEQIMEYNEAITERTDRIYELVATRYERRHKVGFPVVSEEFNAILTILESGCGTIDRVNEKLRTSLVSPESVVTEVISEDYWERLMVAIEEWQQKLTGSYYMHTLLEAAVTANEIKWASRQAKMLLLNSVRVNTGNTVED